MSDFLRLPLAVDEEDSARLNVLNDLESLINVGWVVASYEVSLVDVVRALDRLVTESQVRNCNAACLLGVILEVSLYVLVSVVSDDL